MIAGCKINSTFWENIIQRNLYCGNDIHSLNIFPDFVIVIKGSPMPTYQAFRIFLYPKYSKWIKKNTFYCYSTFLHCRMMRTHFLFFWMFPGHAIYFSVKLRALLINSVDVEYMCGTVWRHFIFIWVLISVQ